jgi:hypothetical protein
MYAVDSCLRFEMETTSQSSFPIDSTPPLMSKMSAVVLLPGSESVERRNCCPSGENSATEAALPR